MGSIKFQVTTLVTTFTFVISALVFTTAIAGPDLVSSDVNGAPLITDEANPAGYSMQDVSADGRYVLLSNFATTTTFGFGQIPLQPETCRILRKDRVTGELLTVFDTPPGNFGSCSNAKISADGNIVVISPSGPVVSCVDGGEVTALIARNITTGTDTEVKTFWTPSPGDIARICVGNGGYSFPGLPLQSISGDARFAVVGYGPLPFGLDANLDGNVDSNYELIDVAAGTIEPIVIDAEEGITQQVYSVAVSEDGNKLALNVRVLTPATDSGSTEDGSEQPTGPSGTILCGQTGRCEPVGELPETECPESGSYWCWGYEPPIVTHAIYIIDRTTGTQSIPEALSDLPAGTTLQANAWSADGSRLSWLEGPIFPIGKCYIGFPDSEPDCLLTEGCSAADCELKVHHYNFSENLRTTQQTLYDPDTLSGCQAIPTTENYFVAHNSLACVPRLSREGDKLLYGRAVTHPFGGDWQPTTEFINNNVCVSRESLAAGGEPEFVECPTSQGPIIVGPGPVPTNDACLEAPDSPLCQYDSGSPGTLNNFFNGGGDGTLGQYDYNDPWTSNQYNKQVVSLYTGTSPTTDNTSIVPAYWLNSVGYNAPVIWHVLNLESNHTSLVSITDQGQLFQSNGTLFSDDGSTVLFRSQDPRLQSDNPEALAATEATLDEACFWSPAGSSSNLRVATNDNIAFIAGDDINIYRETPVFCPVPDPALPAHIFAGDIAAGVDLFVQNRRDRRNGRGAMKTWIGNFSRDNATMVVLNIEVRGLGEGGTVFVAPENDCESYEPVAATSSDDSILIRCEFDALGSHKFQPVHWRMSKGSSTSSGARVTIHTSIESNEYELRPRNNVDVDLIRLPRARPDRRRRR